MKVKVLTLLLLILCRPFHSWGQEVDSVQVVDETTKFKAEQIIIPATLITVGALGLSDDGYRDATRC